MRLDTLTMIELTQLTEALSSLTRSGEIWRARARAQESVLLAVGQWGPDWSVEHHLYAKGEALRAHEPVLFKFEYSEPTIYHRSSLLDWLYSEKGIDSVKLFPDFEGLAQDFWLQSMLTGYKGKRR